jgi:16S rRNA (guanine(966)-N(2))-methyltransferase RsmD
MRIISGSARGTKIDAPEGLDTRPVTDKIRQSLFNIWQFDIAGSSFLDIFSGSGSMGLEALSRNAGHVVMIEKSPKAAKVIESNLKKTHLQDKDVQLMVMDCFDAIKQLSARGEKFDLIYLDPPYTIDSIFIPVMEAMDESNLLKEDGMLVIRTHIDKELPDEFNNLEKFRQKKYGISMAHFYQCKEKSENDSEKSL